MMENKDKKKVIPEIDEEHIMSLMAGGVQIGGLQVESQSTKEPVEEKQAPKEKSRRKGTEGNYRERFLRSHTMIRRGDKSIYIRAEYHERMSRIVQTIGGDQIPLYAYLDNILEHHFEMFEKAITEDFNNNYKPIF